MKRKFERQHIAFLSNEEEYDKLFRAMSPVRCPYWSEPGHPPVLQHRAAFDDEARNFMLRAERIIIKTRYTGSVTYIFADELPLFAAAYREQSCELGYIESVLIETIEREGAMGVKLLNEITGFKVKDITPALHKLQLLGKLFEDQADNDDSRGFYLMSEAFPDADLESVNKIDAISELILRFAYLNIFIDEKMIKSYYKFKTSDINTALNKLLSETKLEKNEYKGKTGYSLLGTGKITADSGINGILALNRNDYLVKSTENSLKDEKFVSDCEKYGGSKKIMQYIMINGEIKGASVGNFRFSMNDIEDICLDLDDEAAKSYKNEIFEALSFANGYPLQSKPPLKYNGK